MGGLLRGCYSKLEYYSLKSSPQQGTHVAESETGFLPHTAYAILGLLALGEERTAYEIKQIADQILHILHRVWEGSTHLALFHPSDERR